MNKKTELKLNHFIEGFDDESRAYAVMDFYIMKGYEIIYIGETCDISEELTLEMIPKIFEGTDQEMFQSYYYHDSYALTPQESINSAYFSKYCIIYKTK